MPPVRTRASTKLTPPPSLLFGELGWSENGTLYVGRNNDSVQPLAFVSALRVTASEALPAGAVVSFWNNNGVESARLANAALGYPVMGFVPQAITSGSVGFVITAKGCINSQALTESGTPLVTGTWFLSGANPGRLASTPVLPGSGHLHQQIGYSSGANLIFDPSVAIARVS